MAKRPSWHTEAEYPFALEDREKARIFAKRLSEVYGKSRKVVMFFRNATMQWIVRTDVTEMEETMANMDRYLDELESSLKHLDIPFERTKIKVHDCHDEVLAYPSFENCVYSYHVVYCSCCGRARDAGLYDHSNEAESPNFIHCTPEAALNYILEEEHKNGTAAKT